MKLMLGDLSILIGLTSSSGKSRFVGGAPSLKSTSGRGVHSELCGKLNSIPLSAERQRPMSRGLQTPAPMTPVNCFTAASANYGVSPSIPIIPPPVKSIDACEWRRQPWLRSIGIIGGSATTAHTWELVKTRCLAPKAALLLYSKHDATISSYHTFEHP